MTWGTQVSVSRHPFSISEFHLCQPGTCFQLSNHINLKGIISSYRWIVFSHHLSGEMRSLQLLNRWMDSVFQQRILSIKNRFRLRVYRWRGKGWWEARLSENSIPLLRIVETCKHFHFTSLRLKSIIILNAELRWNKMFCHLPSFPTTTFGSVF